MKQEVARTLVRDLQTIRAELRAYPNEELLWALPQGVSNSAGTLALHVAGNLQHYIGARLGGTDYVRDRTAEFSDRDVPLSVIEHRIDVAIRVVRETMARLDERRLDETYPEPVGGLQLSTRLFLTHLLSHTAYHLGQIDYHRRLVTGINQPIGPSISMLVKAT